MWSPVNALPLRRYDHHLQSDIVEFKGNVNTIEYKYLMAKLDHDNQKKQVEWENDPNRKTAIGHFRGQAHASMFVICDRGFNQHGGNRVEEVAKPVQLKLQEKTFNEPDEDDDDFLRPKKSPRARQKDGDVINKMQQQLVGK